MSDSVVINLVGELARSRPGYTSLPEDDARTLCERLQRYSGVDRGDVLRFLELFDRPGRWLIVNSLFRQDYQFLSPNDIATAQVAKKRVSKTHYHAFVEGLEAVRADLAHAHLVIRDADVVTAVSLLKKSVAAIERDTEAASLEALNALEREQHRLCGCVIDLCDDAQAVAQRPEFAHTADVREALWELPQLRMHTEAFRAALVPSVSASLVFLSGYIPAVFKPI